MKVLRRLLATAHREEQGQAIVLVAVTMLGLIMMVGLSIDAGQLYVARRTAQEAADAGAYAGAVVHYERTLLGSPIDTAAAISAAYTDAALNGFVDGVGARTVVARVPTTGIYANNTRYVEVVITEQVRTSIVPGGALTLVSVRAVAGAEPLNNAYAIMALNRGNTPSSYISGANAEIHLTGGGILVNSTSATAAVNSQTDATKFTITPSTEHIDIAGNSSSTWPASVTVDRGEPQQADPFSGTPPPSTVGVTVYNAIPGTNVLDPGIWTVALNTNGNNTLYLRPGIYILKAGASGSGNTDLISERPDTTPACASNCGVFIYNTHTNYPNAFRTGIDTCGSVTLTGNATTDLRAQTTGTYKNFLLFQDPACTNEMKVSGNGSFDGIGTVYVPGATFTFDGNRARLTGSQLVANKVNLQQGNITIDFTSGNTAQPILPRLSQ